MCTLIKCIGLYRFAKLHVILYNHVHKNTWGDKIAQRRTLLPGQICPGGQICLRHRYMIFCSPCISYLIFTNHDSVSYSKKYCIRPTYTRPIWQVNLVAVSRLKIYEYTICVQTSVLRSYIRASVASLGGRGGPGAAPPDWASSLI